MLRLTREVRFAINPASQETRDGAPTNGYAGFPSLAGLGHYFTLQVTVAGAFDPASSYLVNIKEIDAAVRTRAVPLVAEQIRTNRFAGGGRIPGLLFNALQPAWPRGTTLQTLRLHLSPFLAFTAHASELPMVRLSQKFEFSATHRLHNPELSADENRKLFGKCNNPHGHGHNYEVQVTLAGEPDENGILIDVPAFERIVASAVIQEFDHRNLNVEIPEFRHLVPTVENIAITIYRRLRPAFAGGRGKLAAVTVWETPKTWAEYQEP